MRVAENRFRAITSTYHDTSFVRSLVPAAAERKHATRIFSVMVPILVGSACVLGYQAYESDQEYCERLGEHLQRALVDVRSSWLDISGDAVQIKFIERQC